MSVSPMIKPREKRLTACGDGHLVPPDARDQRAQRGRDGRARSEAERNDRQPEQPLRSRRLVPGRERGGRDEDEHLQRERDGDISQFTSLILSPRDDVHLARTVKQTVAAQYRPVCRM